MNDFSDNFLQYYQPKSALVIFQHAAKPDDYYLESYDIDQVTGQPINAHPLTIDEATALGTRLNAAQERHIGFLVPERMMPENVLYVNPRGEGMVIWYTKASKQKLYFKESLGIKDGAAHVPALLWKATKTDLFIFALTADKRPNESTTLYHIPLFNTASSGDVCIGEVDMPPLDDASLEEFITAWHDFFFSSRFTHLNGHLPTTVKPVELWNDLIESGKPFPNEMLVSAKRTLKSILPS